MFVAFITSAIAMGVVYLYGSIGETIIEKGGNLNLGIPGIMCLGALGGAVGVNLYSAMFASLNLRHYFVASFRDVVVGDMVVAYLLILLLLLITILFAALFAAVGGLIYAFFTVTLQSNQNVTGLVLTTFGVGLMKSIGSVMNADSFTVCSRGITRLFFGYEKLGFFGEIFLSHGFLVYLAFALAIVLSVFLRKSRTGLFLRAVGESPQTADSQGINVSRYKYTAILVGSAIAGLGGLYYVFDRSGGSTFVEADIEAFGWLAVALVIFSMWKPKYSIIGSILFGGLYILPNYLDIPFLTLKLFAMLPYVITVIVLIITSILDAKNSQPPKSLGLNYFREER